MKQSKDFFWPSYVDLMTALFLTMLVLFVLSYKSFRDKERELQVQLKEKKKLDEIREALSLLESAYFKYNDKYRRYELKLPVQFKTWDYILPDESTKPLVDAGRFLAKRMQALDENVQYLVVIEGRAAREPRLPVTDSVNTDRKEVRQLSYNRAMAVVRLWEEHGVAMPSNVEVVAAGSGFGGLGRYTGLSEGLNRRFIIQIQPKIGTIGKI